MVRRRIEFDPDDGTLYSAIAHGLSCYGRAHEEGWLVAAAGDADTVQQLARQLADHALLEADKSASRRQLADALGGVTHGTVNYRLKRAHARVHGEPAHEGGSTEIAEHYYPADIAARLRATDTEDEGAAWLDELALSRDGLLAVAGQLSLSRLERLSKPQIKQRLIKQAITARRKFEGLRSGWQDD